MSNRGLLPFTQARGGVGRRLAEQAAGEKLGKRAGFVVVHGTPEDATRYNQNCWELAQLCCPLDPGHGPKVPGVRRFFFGRGVPSGCRPTIIAVAAWTWAILNLFSTTPSMLNISPKAAAVIAVFEQAAQANRHTLARQGNVIALTPDNAADVLVTADLHGQQANFDAILREADLEQHPRRHLVLQEVCHGGPCYETNGGCRSHLLLEQVARLKVQYPERVHFILSNHELAELTDYPILKARRMLNLAFRLGLQEAYGFSADEVRQAFLPFLETCPIAVRIGNIFVSHSLPEAVDRRGFDATILDRPLTDDDWAVRSPLFDMVWGRDFSQENADAFAQAVGAELLIHGHEPCPEGFRVPNERQVIIDCCGMQPTCILIPVGKRLTHAELVGRVKFLEPAC